MLCCQILSRDLATTNEVNKQKKARGLVILILCEINTKEMEEMDIFLFNSTAVNTARLLLIIKEMRWWY